MKNDGISKVISKSITVSSDRGSRSSIFEEALARRAILTDVDVKILRALTYYKRNKLFLVVETFCLKQFDLPDENTYLFFG